MGVERERARVDDILALFYGTKKRIWNKVILLKSVTSIPLRIRYCGCYTVLNMRDYYYFVSRRKWFVYSLCVDRSVTNEFNRGGAVLGHLKQNKQGEVGQ